MRPRTTRTLTALAVALPLVVSAAPAPAYATAPAPSAESQQLSLPWHPLRPSANPVELTRAIRPLSVSYEYEGKTYDLDDFLTRSTTQGFVVLDGQTQKIVADRYWTTTPNTRFQSWSAAKSFTGTLIGVAVDEGLIGSIDDPVTKYVPELKGSGYDGVSIRDLLRMSSGVKWSEGTSVPPVHAAASLGASIHRMARAQVRGWEPGSRFEYTSMNSHVLAWVVSKVSGKPYYQYLQEKIWDPAGMAGAAYVGSDWQNADLGYCCIYSTAADFARFGLLYLHEGQSGGKQVVSKSWVKLSTTPSASFNEGYGLHWWLGGSGEGDYMASGLGGQKIYVSPKYGVVIAKLTTLAPTSGSEETIAFRAIAAEVARTRTSGSNLSQTPLSK